MSLDTPTTSKYRHIRDIADGGMGSVGLAVREEGPFRRVYAVKRLKPAYRQDERVRSMFLEEARIAGLLHHSNIVSVVDVGEDEEGPYLVMEFVQGVSLSELINEARHRDELIPMQICVQVIKEVAQGLHAAHELTAHDGEKLDLVHRDVSPQNILVGYDGLARLTDFGIAKALGRPDRTNTGFLKGKYGYFSPEQLQFEDPTRRSDVFSLGIVFYEMLSCQRLYGEEKPAHSARRIVKEPPPDLDEVRDDVHPGVLELLVRMLAKDPERRPSSAEEVAERLNLVLINLAGEQGAMSVSKYVRARFEDKRVRQQSEIEDLTAGVDLHSISDRPARGKSLRRGAYLGLAGLALLALALWFRSGAPVDPEVNPPQVATAESAADLVPETREERPSAPPADQDSVSEAEAQDPALERPSKPKRRPRARTQQPRDSVPAKPTQPLEERAGKELMDWER